MKIKNLLPFILIFLNFSLFAQTISINPNKANKGQSLPVTITGVGTNFNRGSNTVSFIKQGSPTSSITISNLTVLSNTIMGGMLNVNAGAASGLYTVSVSNTLNATINLNNGFTVNSTSSTPSLVSVTPARGEAGQSLTVTITGLNTNFSMGSNTVKFFKQGSESFDIFEISNDITNDNIILSDILISPDAPLGTYSVGVENDIDGLLMLNNSFNVIANPRSITNITPNNGKQGETITITITGSGTAFNVGMPGFYFLKQGEPSTDIEQISANATSATSATVQIKINPETEIGVYDIGYFNLDDGFALKVNAFTVNQKSIGFNEITNSLIKIYPNPIKNTFYIKSNQLIKEVQIFDLTGRLISTKIPITTSKDYEINIEDLLLPKGIYYLKTLSDFGVNSNKIIIE